MHLHDFNVEPVEIQCSVSRELHQTLVTMNPLCTDDQILLSSVVVLWQSMHIKSIQRP